MSSTTAEKKEWQKESEENSKALLHGNFKEFTPAYQQKLLKVYDEIIFPLCLSDSNNYWKRVFDHRENATTDDGSSLWTEISPFQDTIKMMITAQDEEKKSGQMKFYATVQLCPIFWDAVFSYYLIRKPEIYISPCRLVRTFLETMGKAGVNPRIIDNFNADILFWMDEITKGKYTFDTIENPLKQIFSMRWILEATQRYKEKDLYIKDFQNTPEVREHIKDLKQRIETMFHAIFPDESSSSSKLDEVGKTGE